MDFSVSEQGISTATWRGMAAVIAAQRPHYVLWLPVLLGAGICAYFSLKFEPSWVGALAVLLAPALAVLWQWRRARAGGSVALLLLFGLALAFGAGFAAGKVRTEMVRGPVLEKQMRFANVTGTIRSLELLESGRGSRAVLDDLSIEEIASEKTPRRIRMTISKDEGLRPGQRIRVLGGLNPPSAPVAPGSFDFQRYAYFRELGAMGFAYKAPEILSEQKGGFYQGLENYRLMLAQAAKEHVGERETGVVIALLTGERAAMSEDLWDDVRIAGLAHIIAISGMNIGMAAGAAFFLSRLLMALFPRFALYHPIKSYAAVIAFIAAFAYALIVGMSVPTFRALIMTGLFLMAIGLNRSPFSMRLAAVSAGALLLFYPDILLGASFQMSFAAVIGLIWFYDVTRDWWVEAYTKAGWLQRAMIYLAGVCLTTILATIVTAPFSLYHFQQVATYGVAANFIVVPLASFIIMPLAILVYFLAPLGLADWPLAGMAWGVDVMLDIARIVAGWPHAVVHWPVWSGAALGIMTFGMLFMLLWAGRSRWLGLLPLAVGMVMVVVATPPDILISSTGKLWAARMDSDRMMISSRVADRFTAEVWTQESGLPEGSTEKIPNEGLYQGENGMVSCDADACRMEMDGAKVAFVNQPAALATDCAWADVVVARMPVEKECAAGAVIDRFDVWRNGSVAIWVRDGEEPVIRSVRDLRGDRPWAMNNGR
ncbi:ComEC/Rec2 family competence protein [Micavibrio aeruginosavorus]|nr:ComEC/Rec2 family competence protein [Micavibrio aeruginosavorus]